MLTYWFYIGSIALLFLSIEEQKFFKFGFGEDKKNYIMLGITFSLLSHISRGIWFILLVSLVLVILQIHFKILGFSDLSTGSLFWLFFGLFIMDYYLFIIYICILYIYIGIAKLIKMLMKSQYETPNSTLIAVAFYTLCLVCGLY